MFKTPYNTQSHPMSYYPSLRWILCVISTLKVCVIATLQMTKLKQKLNDGNRSRLQDN